MKSRYQILTSVKNWYQIIICEKMAPKLTRVKNLYIILTHVNNLYQYIKHMKNWYLIISYVIDNTVKNGNQMQNAAYFFFFFFLGGGGGAFYQCEEYAYMLYKIWLLACFSQSVRYWYEICNIFLPIFHVMWGIGTNYSQCEIYEVWILRFNKAS